MAYVEYINEVYFIKSVVVNDCYVNDVKSSDEQIDWIQSRDFGIRIKTEGRMVIVPWSNIQQADVIDEEDK